MRCAADIACKKHRAYRPLPRSSIRAAVRAPWQLCLAARGPPAVAAAAACAYHRASNLSRSLAGWRCLAACAAAPRTRPYVRWMPRRRREGIPSTQSVRAAPFWWLCVYETAINFSVLATWWYHSSSWARVGSTISCPLRSLQVPIDTPGCCARKNVYLFLPPYLCHL